MDRGGASVRFRRIANALVSLILPHLPHYYRIYRIYRIILLFIVRYKQNDRGDYNCLSIVQVC